MSLLQSLRLLSDVVAGISLSYLLELAWHVIIL